MLASTTARQLLSRGNVRPRSAALRRSSSSTVRVAASMGPPPAQPPIVKAARQAHTSTVVWLHGLGDTGDGWSELAGQLSVALPGTKFIFPTAAIRPITMNRGFPMPAWFDIASLSDLTAEDRGGISESAAYVDGLLDAEEAAGIAPERLVVAGFSQGGAIALHVGLRRQRPLGGVLALSTWLPLNGDYPAQLAAGAKASTRVLMCHGTADPVVRPEFGQRSRDKLQEMGVTVEMKTYPGMAHSACDAELRDIAEFLKQRLA